MLARRIIEWLGANKRIDVRINGDRPHDIRVHNRRFYRRLLRNYSLGMGEGYMDGDWSCEDLEGMLRRCFLAGAVTENTSVLTSLQHRLINMQTPFRSKKAVEQHYDIGNDLYEAMLDSYMQYSGAYWRNATTLDQAQQAKLDLICRKLDLSRGLRVLDVGCGFGGLMRFMKDRYGVDAVGITLSGQQQRLAQEKFGIESIFIQDYRELFRYPRHSFDRVVSVGMFEHVGYKNYADFFRAVRSAIKDEGIFLLQTIGNNVSVTRPDDWVNKYIFPNGMTPSLAQLGQAMEGAWVMEDWHSLGPNYGKTLRAWHQRSKAFFQSTDRYPARFQRMWEFYLVGCQVTFDLRASQLWQIVLSPRGVQGGLARLD
ncbi:MAG: cyclopropane fatty acyl phospholipid synthase [Gammaproteobacteria bacterium]